MDSNLVWHNYKITKTTRNEQNGHSSLCLWFTGLSGSGKSTIADAVEQKLFQKGVHTYLLDGDNVRNGLNSNLGFSDEDRVENIRRVGEVAALFVDAGVIVLSAFISPFNSDRDAVRAKFVPGEFIEIFVDCPLDVCEKRDVKGLYAKARRGEIKSFTGIDSPYEKPVNPEIVVRSAEESIEDSVNKILEYLIINKKINIR